MRFGGWIMAVVLATVGITTAAGMHPVVAQANACQAFASQDEAQAHLEQHPEDAETLDPAGVGVACEEHFLGMTSDQITAEAPLDARLGGTIDSFEARYGEPIEAGDSFSGARYAVAGFEAVFVREHEGYVYAMQLFAPRPEGIEWPRTVPHEDNWTVAQAEVLVNRFLPRDAILGPAEGVSPFFPNVTLWNGLSDALAQEVPPSVYDYAMPDPTPGEFSFGFANDDEGGISDFFLRLGWERDTRPVIDQDAATPETGTHTPHGTGDTVRDWVRIDGTGIVTFTATHDGQRNFIVEIYDASGEVWLLFNEIGPYQGTRAMPMSGSGDFRFAIRADGAWTLTIET